MVTIRALGPLQASRGGEPVPLGGPKQQAVLALLVASRGRPVSDDSLVLGVWGEDAGDSTRGTLQTYVSNLRRALGHDAIARAGDGYRLDLDDGAVDVWRFEDAVERTGATEPATRRAARLREVLSLWRGQPFAGAAQSRQLDEEARRLEQLRLAALEAALESELEGGAPAAVVTELEELCREHPSRERFHALLMLALYRSGRQSDALDAYRRAREHLAEEIGVEPGPGLQRVHQLVLQQDPTLDPAGGGAAPPSGVVTFLFTDIEGSTRLFHDLGERYAEALDQHRRILREAWAEHGGYEASVEGDGALAAFASAVDAVRAAVAAQRALHAATWPAGSSLRVRMGLHSGLASPRGGDYVALAVHEAARVMSAAHGGQILVSERCAERVMRLDEIALELRGRFRLRGFEQPVRLYEAAAEGLPRGFGPLRATPADDHNLVRHPTEMVGREDLVVEVSQLLGPGRLVTLVGPGGVGKTRTASEVGLLAASKWRDGVWFVDLAPLGDGELVPVVVADTLAAPTRPGSDRATDLVEHLHDRRCVVLLDNCEHLMAACRELVDRLLSHCPEVSVLATSREPLHRPGEILRPVAPLTVPDESAATAAEVRDASACRLFELRGAAQRPGFTITDDTAREVAAICRRLDGLPLLIELAAALLTVRSPREIRSALGDDTAPLVSQDPLVGDRHRTVEGLIGWSYELLDESEQAALRRLSVFGGSFTLDAARAAVAVEGVTTSEVPRLVWALVDRSLVSADLGSDETRYRLLETVRRYAGGVLEAAGETTMVATHVADEFLERVGPWLSTDVRWVENVGVEVDNLRALLPLLPADQHERAQAIACSLARYHDASQSFREGIREVSRHVEALSQPSATRVALLTRLADLHLRTGDTDAAAALVEQASEVQVTHGAPEWDDAAVDRTRGEIARRRGDLQGAVTIAREALERDLSDRGRARMFNLLGTALGALGDLDGAWSALEQELELNRQAGYDAAVSASHGNLAETALRLGDLEQAAYHQARCLDLALVQGSTTMVAFSLIVASRLAGTLEQWEVAIRLHARAEVLLEETGLTLYADDQRESDRLLADAHEALGAERFREALAAGRSAAVPEAARSASHVFEELAPATHVDVSDGRIRAGNEGTTVPG